MRWFWHTDLRLSTVKNGNDPVLPVTQQAHLETLQASELVVRDSQLPQPRQVLQLSERGQLVVGQVQAA